MLDKEIFNAYNEQDKMIISRESHPFIFKILALCNPIHTQSFKVISRDFKEKREQLFEVIKTSIQNLIQANHSWRSQKNYEIILEILLLQVVLFWEFDLVIRVLVNLVVRSIS